MDEKCSSTGRYLCVAQARIANCWPPKNEWTIWMAFLMFVCHVLCMCGMRMDCVCVCVYCAVHGMWCLCAYYILPVDDCVSMYAMVCEYAREPSRCRTCTNHNFCLQLHMVSTIEWIVCVSRATNHKYNGIKFNYWNLFGRAGETKKCMKCMYVLLVITLSAPF